MKAADSVKFMAFLSQAAFDQGLSIGLKNSATILTTVLPAMQWSVNEQCVQNEECDSYSPMIANSKPVFHIEYPNQVQGNSRISSSLCATDGPAAGAAQFSTVIKNDNLDGYVRYCDGEISSTP
jgi:Glycoside-hydrolase family GH114